MHVGCELGFEVTDDVALALQIAPATSAGEVLDERLSVVAGGLILSAEAGQVTEVRTDHGGRVHVVRAGTGPLSVSYSATIRAASPPTAPEPAQAGPGRLARAPVPVDAESLVFLRQSRYCPSDQLAAFAVRELAGVLERPERARAVAEWVNGRLAYTPGASTYLTTAVDTLLAGNGVCRDFAHLTIALCRALGVPARLVSVYAPGLLPMDFHAVVEVRRGGLWEALDPSRLAPRQSLVRIATGRDAADTAFATTVSGDAELVSSWVTAVVDGDLPRDDHAGIAVLP